MSDTVTLSIKDNAKLTVVVHGIAFEVIGVLETTMIKDMQTNDAAFTYRFNGKPITIDGTVKVEKI